MNKKYHKIIEILRPHFILMGFVLLLTLLNVGLEAISPLPFKVLIDDVLDDNSKLYVAFFNSRFIFGILVVSVFFLSNIFSNIVEYLRSVTLKNMIKKIIFDFSQKAFLNIELLNIGFYRTQEIGDFIYRLNNDVYALGGLIEDGLFPIVSSSLFVIVTTTILFFIDVRLTFISLVALPFLAGGLYLFNKRIMLVSQKSEKYNSTLFSFVQETLTQLRTIQAFSREQTESKEFDQKIKSALQIDFKLEKLNILLTLIIGIIIATSYSVIIGYGVLAVTSGEITTGLLVIFIFYLDNLTTPILSIIYAVSSIKENIVRIQHMDAFFDKKMQMSSTNCVNEITHTDIVFKNVNVEVNNKSRVLNNVSLTFPENQLTVLVGVSGSGKTSVISLLPRLINEPSSGEILLGGQRIDSFDVHTLRESISLVPQENYLFNTTIKEIIGFGNLHCTDEDIHRAAKLAVADEFIENLPGGYSFKVGEGGNYLSGGQRQRLLIARGFVKEAKIYILDEPLSALDLHTRKKVWANIQKVCKGKTTIIVTNILDVISHADQVVILDKGSVSESGNHIDLHHHSNLYNLLLRAD